MKRLEQPKGIVLLLLVAACSCGTHAALDGERLETLGEQFQTAFDQMYKNAQETEEMFSGAIAAFMLPEGEAVRV